MFEVSGVVNQQSAVFHTGWVNTVCNCVRNHNAHWYYTAERGTREQLLANPAVPPPLARIQ